MIENRDVCISDTNICISIRYISISITDICISIKVICHSKKYRYLYLLKEISVFEMQISAINGQNSERFVILRTVYVLHSLIST